MLISTRIRAHVSTNANSHDSPARVFYRKFLFGADSLIGTVFSKTADPVSAHGRLTPVAVIKYHLKGVLPDNDQSVRSDAQLPVADPAGKPGPVPVRNGLFRQYDEIIAAPMIFRKSDHDYRPKASHKAMTALIFSSLLTVTEIEISDVVI